MNTDPSLQLKLLVFILIIASLLFLRLPTVFQKNKLYGSVLVIFILLAGAFHVNRGFNLSATMGVIILIIYITLATASFFKYKTILKKTLISLYNGEKARDGDEKIAN